MKMQINRNSKTEIGYKTTANELQLICDPTASATNLQGKDRCFAPSAATCFIYLAPPLKTRCCITCCPQRHFGVSRARPKSTGQTTRSCPIHFIHQRNKHQTKPEKLETMSPNNTTDFHEHHRNSKSQNHGLLEPWGSECLWLLCMMSCS
jgi:hypothetical protein